MSSEAENVAPRPSPWLLVFSWMIIVGCICLASVGFAGLIARAWDPCTWFSGMLSGSYAVLLGVMQYRGTFYHNRNAVSCSMVLLFVCGGLTLFFTFVCCGEFLLESTRWPPWEPLVIAAGTVALTIPAGWLNLLWSKELERTAKAVVRPAKPRYQLSLRGLLISVAALSLSLAIITAVVRNEPAEVGEHVETESPPFGIPRGAKDICWRQGSRGIELFEFTVDEPAFRGWVQRYIDSAPLDTPKSIRTVTAAEPFHTITYKTRVPLTDPGGGVTVTDGLAYSWSEEDRGVHAVWERPTNRVYFYTHSH